VYSVRLVQLIAMEVASRCVLPIQAGKLINASVTAVTTIFQDLVSNVLLEQRIKMVHANNFYRHAHPIASIHLVDVFVMPVITMFLDNV
jgi:hypothetical protein